MTDQQLKIRIKLQQPHRSTEEQPSEVIEPVATEASEQTEKPPFDWFKITIALLICGCLLGLLVYFFVSQGDSEPDQSIKNEVQNESRADIQPVADPIAPIIEENTSISEIPDESQNSAENTNAIDHDADPSIQPNIEVVTQDTIHESITDTITYPVPPQKPSIKFETHHPTELSSIVNASPKDHPQVIRAQLSHNVKNREPIDDINHILIDSDTSPAIIYFFTQLKDFADQSVKVSWYRNDQLIVTTTLQIGANNWRTYASKLLTQKSLGSWRVVLSDQSANHLAERIFTVAEAPQEH